MVRAVSRLPPNFQIFFARAAGSKGAGLIELRVRQRCGAIIGVAALRDRFVGIENELAMHPLPGLERHSAGDIGGATCLNRGDRARIGAATIFRVVAAESLFPAFFTLTIQNVDEVWIVFSITRSGAGVWDFGVFAWAIVEPTSAMATTKVKTDR
jgi:hypothetical protein